MRAIHHKKCWPPFFDDIVSGSKNFEVRLGDFDVAPGDLLAFEEYVPGKHVPEAGMATGRICARIVTYSVKTRGFTFWPQEQVAEHGFTVMGIRPPDKGETTFTLNPLSREEAPNA